MRIIFGVLGVLIALVVVGILKKKTVGGLPAPLARQNPVPIDQAIILPVTLSGATRQVQSQHIQQQIKQAVEGAMQQARPVPDEP